MAPKKLRPALLGGLVTGILSALPVVGLCCCLWILGGGVLAAYLMQQEYPEPITAGDGAAVGVLAGAFGAVIWQLIAVPINLATGTLSSSMMQRALENARDVPPEARQFLEAITSPAGSIVWFSVVFVLILIVCMMLATLGGLLGAVIFRREKPPAPGPIDQPARP